MKETFELEYQREAPLSMFYIWHMGHLEAYNILDMDENTGKKVFALYENGIFKAFTQKNNLDKIKKAIRTKPEQELAEIIENYRKNYKKFKENKKLVLDKEFITKTISEFVIVFVLGDMPDHPLQKESLQARIETEKLFYTIWENLKELVKRDRFDYYSYEELIENKSIIEKKLKSRERALLLEDRILPLGKNEDFEKYIKDIQLEKELKLSKYMSREHSLFYAHVWNEANRDLFDKYIPGTNIENMIFSLNKLGVLEVYYDLKELETIFNKITEGIANKPKLLDKVISDFYQYWNKLLPYLKGKKIMNTKELEEYYKNWTNWWGPMAYIFVIPDRENMPRELREKALKVRKETQEYSDDGDRVFTKFIEENYPKYKHLINLLTPSEAYRIDKLSKKEIDNIEKRKEGVALATLYGKSKLISVNELADELKENKLTIEEAKKEQTKELTGLAASPGIVKGKVRLVLNKEDLKKVNKGDIMVTYATSPDYVPAMKKCLAIVTDEGGIVCHAAIVSRELHIPCVVGTKLATQVLKNGQEIEVDANRGIIKLTKEDN